MVDNRDFLAVLLIVTGIMLAAVINVANYMYKITMRYDWIQWAGTALIGSLSGVFCVLILIIRDITLHVK